MGIDANVSKRFWESLERLVAECGISIDRPKGTAHPRYPSFVYPLDYGYINDTRADDGNQIDVWRGSIPDISVTGAICTVDLHKRDMEVKVLIGCTHEEAERVLKIHNEASQSGVLIERK